MRGRDADATEKDKEKCQEKLQEMSKLVTKFIIRRTNDLLSKYRTCSQMSMICKPHVLCITVPVKYEQVVFCGLSDFQLSLYRLFISSPEIKALLRGKDSQPLKAINVLKKLCNHPELLDLPGDLKGSDGMIPPGFVGAKERSSGGGGKGRSGPGVKCEWSGKFVVLER